MEADAESGAPHQPPVHTAFDLSPFEQLPREIIARIIENAPDAVFEMRLACRILKSLVDEYARRPCAIPIVRRIAFTDELDAVTAWLTIPHCRTAVFELRLTVHQPALKTKIHRYFRDDPELPSQYCVDISSLSDDVIFGLRSCMGTRITETSLPHYDKALATSMFKLIEGIKIEKLEMFIDVPEEGTGDRLLENLRAHSVDELFLAVREVKLADPAEFLLNLSSVVRCLLIGQQDVPHKELNERHFLGTDDFDWAPAIIGMFERRLDKLLIRNNYGAFLTLRSADAIRLRLPRLGKNIWFETRTNAYDRHEERLDYVANGHSIRVVRWTPVHNALVIKHCSRESEAFEFQF